MADDVFPSTDPKVATDHLPSGAHVQKVKVIDGTSDSSTPLVIDATYGAAVDVKRLPDLIPAHDKTRVAGGSPLSMLWAYKELVGGGGSQEVIALAAGKKLRIHSIVLATTNDDFFDFYSGTNLLIEQMPIKAGAVLQIELNKGMFCETNAGEAFKIDPATADAGVIVNYTQV